MPSEFRELSKAAQDAIVDAAIGLRSGSDDLSENVKSEIRDWATPPSRVNRPFGPMAEYPVGTKAKAIMGGHWYKTDHGWKWNGPGGCGGTFPTPGADVDYLEVPAWWSR
jgi:hypothetical protein